MSPLAEALWSLLFLAAVVVISVVWLGALTHLMFDAFRIGWEVVG